MSDRLPETDDRPQIIEMPQIIKTPPIWEQWPITVIMDPPIDSEGNWCPHDLPE